MRGSVRIYSDDYNWKKYRKALNKDSLSWRDNVEYYYIERDTNRLYVECREYTREYSELSKVNFKVNGLIELDLTNKKLVQFSSSLDWKDKNLLTYLGVEFLLSDYINNRTYETSFIDFVKALLKIYTKPNDILKNELIKNGFELHNFPMSQFKEAINYDRNVWHNKVSHYLPIYFYMKHSLDLTMFFKHISKLKKMALVDMFRDAEELGYKVNMRWSYNRIKLEHDNWSYEVRDKRLLSEDNEPLLTGYTYPIIQDAELLTSKFALVYEGQEMKHCVGGSGYWESCKRGTSAIYKYQNKESKRLRATIEIRINQEDGSVTLNQMQRKGNRLYIPEEIKQSIRKDLVKYKIPEIVKKNNNLKKDVYEVH